MSLFSCPWPNSKEKKTKIKGKNDYFSNLPVFALDIGILLIPVYKVHIIKCYVII